MLCPKCKIIEMMVLAVNNNEVKNYCRKCGNEIISYLQEIKENAEENDA